MSSEVQAEASFSVQHAATVPMQGRERELKGSLDEWSRNWNLKTGIIIITVENKSDSVVSCKS